MFDMDFTAQRRVQLVLQGEMAEKLFEFKFE